MLLSRLWIKTSRLINRRLLNGLEDIFQNKKESISLNYTPLWFDQLRLNILCRLLPNKDLPIIPQNSSFCKINSPKCQSIAFHQISLTGDKAQKNCSKSYNGTVPFQNDYQPHTTPQPTSTQLKRLGSME